MTPALREWYVEGDLEELEYAALTPPAARRSPARGRPDAPPRRVVLAVDVPEASATTGRGGGRRHGPGLRLQPVPWSALASVHVDGYEAERLVADAASAVQCGGSGDEDAQFTVDSAEDESLLWYAVQEADDLLGGAAGAARRDRRS